MRTEQEAAALANEQLAFWEKKELDGVEIRDRQLSGTVRDGQYVLTAQYACVEDIAVEEAIPTQIAGGTDATEK